jgi:dynein heavy chain 1
VDWFGDWNETAMFQVASEFTAKVDISDELAAATESGLMSDFTSHVSKSGAKSSEDAFLNLLSQSMVDVHKAVSDIAAMLLRKQGVSYYLTPRHFLDFIKHFLSLHAEKTAQIVDQQLHLNRGLDKLVQTEKEVAELKGSLREYEERLAVKSQAANEKLQQMMKEQREAEESKKASEEMSVIVDKQTLEVVSRREAATKELSTVEPLVAEAKDAVKEIKKKQLDELRALPNPPAAVQFCLQAVCTMLGKEKIAVDWEGIRKIIRDAEFIPSIVEFDTSQIDEKLRKKMDKFTSNELFEFETVNRGSKACGPLVKWVRAQLSYSSVLDRVAPLRAELSNLESQLDDLQQKQGVLNASIKTLEESINKYKEEYASLIAEAEHIKAEKQQVQVKTDRSTALLVSLSQERQRWESQTKGFARDLSTLVGDSLLAAAFMTYAGFFDEHYRQAFLMPKWAAALEKRFLPTRSSLSLVEMLSTPAQRLVWQSAGLPDDEVAVENAVMLQRFNRYPLVIDPSGQGLRFLMKSRSASAPGAGSSAVVKLSFLDGAFMASLEDAVRCGTTLIVEDVEHLDPVLNPVLNREVQKTGGRQLVRIGNREVDLSPSFNLFLVTRDPGARFSPDLSSRVTFVNFSLTPGSLVNQSLATVLRAERPEMEERRSGVLKAQGEFRVKLRQLEESLLSALAESSGNLLENDAVLRQLERIKQDATEVQLRVQETDSLMAEINQTSVVYNTFASAASKLFFAIQRLAEISPLYQFSLDSFNKIVRSVLDMPLSDDGPRGSTTRLSQLVRSLFRACFDRVRPSVLYDDALALAVRFAQIFCAECAASDSISDDAIDVLLRGSAAGVGKMVTSPKSPSQMGIRVRDALPNNVRDQISSSQLELLETVLSLPLFAQMAQSVVSHDEKVLDFLQQLLSADAAETVSMSASASVDEIRSAFSSLLLLKALRPDRLVFGAMRFISAVFGSEFLEATQIDVSSSLASAVQKGDPLSPLMLVSAPGYDPSGQIDDLASVSKKTDIVYVALGSSESLEAADRAVAGAIRAGQWVVLKNVHLALSWLETLEKRLHALDSSSSSSLGAVASRGPTSTTRVHENFRLFLTSEVHPGLPSSLLTRSFVLFFEPQAGVRAAVLQAYATAISPERSDRVPVERSRLHFLIAWLHAVIVGRLRYVPLGWTKAYEFNESDLRIALDVVDAWVDTVAKGRVNVRPDELPWGALRQLLIRSVYGGRMETSVDMKILDSLVSQYICIEAFREDYALVSGETPVSLPLQFTRRSQIMSWLHNLSATETPMWLGLHASAQTMLRANQGRVLISKLVLLQSLYEEEAAYDQVESDKKVKEEQVVALGGAQLLKAAQAWLSLLPPTSISQPTSSSALPDPLRRFFAREALVAQQTVTTVRSDLDLLSQALRGEVKLSNLVRALHKDLTADVIPGRWRLFRIPPGVGAASFVRSLKARCDQLQSLISASGQAAAELHLSLGSLFFPHAFLTAVQQSVAAAYATSLEAVRLRFVVQVKGSTPFESRLPCTFVIDGLEVQGGGVWDDSGYDSLRDTSGRSALPSATLQWTLSTEAADSDSKQGLEMPIYTDSSRTDLLYSIVLPSVGASSSESRSGFAQRAAAVVASSMM